MTDNLNLLDLEELDSITGGDGEIKEEIFKLFLDSISNDVYTLQLYIKRELRMEAEVQAHTMKGVARSIAAKKLENLAFSIETLCKEGKLLDSGSLMIIQNLEVVVGETTDAIKEQLSKMKLLNSAVGEEQS